MDYFSLIMLLFFCVMIWYARNTGNKHTKMFGKPKVKYESYYDRRFRNLDNGYID